MLLSHDGVAVIGVAGASGSGKTTLLEALMGHLLRHGLRIGCVKHTHHDFAIDRPGKDSHRLRDAGARQVLVSGPGRWALTAETATTYDLPLAELLPRLALAELDLVLVEGFRATALPRIAVHRAALGQTLPTNEPDLLAIATDLTPLPTHLRVPVFALREAAPLAAFVQRHVAAIRDLRGTAPPA